MTLDAEGNIYFSERDAHRIRKVGRTGTISTVASGTESGFAGDGGLADAAQLAYPEGLAIDSSGNIYVIDSLNHRIRKIETVGAVTTVAGSGDTLAAGHFTGGFGGDGSGATDTLLGRPLDVAVDAIGNLHIADWSNHRIRKVELSGVISNIAGTSKLASQVMGSSHRGLAPRPERGRGRRRRQNLRSGLVQSSAPHDRYIWRDSDRSRSWAAAQGTENRRRRRARRQSPSARSSRAGAGCQWEYLRYGRVRG